MNELESPLKIATDTELVAEIQKEYTLKGSMKTQRGLILWAVMYPELTAEKVHITETPIMNFDRTTKVERKAFFDPKVIYMWAMNKENAIRKIQRSIELYMKKKQEITNHYKLKSK